MEKAIDHPSWVRKLQIEEENLMLALTIHQPWATLIALGLKKVEYRSWPTKVRGLIAIHAASRSPHDYDGLLLSDRARKKLGPAEKLPRGSIVAVARICEVRWSDEDCYEWHLADVVPVKPPVPAVGKQRLWHLDVATERKLMKRAGMKAKGARLRTGNEFFCNQLRTSKGGKND